MSTEYPSHSDLPVEIQDPPGAWMMHVTLGIAIISLILLMLSVLCGCCTARVKHTGEGVEVFGRIEHTETTTFPDGRVCVTKTDTTSGNSLDTTKTIFSSVLSTLSGVVQRVSMMVEQ